MSSTFPPDGPHDGAGSGGSPEYLEQGSGGPLTTGAARRGPSRRAAFVAGGAVLGLALVGGGVWAAMAFFATGPQPAEALPDTTLGYASIDLDPSGGQKLEAIEMMRKFPAFRDEIGLDTDDDIRKKVFDESGLAEECDGIDYADDIEPWLGDRAAVAAVDTGEEQPVAAVVVQVKDEGAAEDGFTQLKDCAGGDEGGWAISGGWAVIAETTDIAEAISDGAANGSLADDDDYQRWTDEVGDAGVMSLYASPDAGTFLAENLGDMAFPGTQLPSTGASVASSSSAEESAFSSTTEELPSEEPLPDELSGMLEDFQGAAATLRFDDGALELEMAGDSEVLQYGMPISESGGDAMATLPEDTAAAFGLGFPEGWFSAMIDQISTYSGGEVSAEELIAEAEDATGLALPEDAETLLGESAAVAIGADFDPEEFFNSDDGAGLPIAAKVKGDPEAIEAVLDKLRAQVPPGELDVLSDSEGDMVAIGVDQDYVASVLEDGSLGESDTFTNVVREADQSGVILYVNFDAGDDWLVSLVGDDDEAAENLQPLEGLGISSWVQGDAAHSVLRVTTD